MKTRHRNIRLENYDYRNGWFFVTNQTYCNEPILKGKIRKLVLEQLDLLNEIDGVWVDTRVVMPTHLHAILIFDGVAKPLNRVWGEFKGRSSYLVKKQSLLAHSLWQRNFYEHIIRNERALMAVRRYILKNAFELVIPWNDIYREVGFHGVCGER